MNYLKSMLSVLGSIEPHIPISTIEDPRGIAESYLRLLINPTPNRGNEYFIRTSSRGAGVSYKLPLTSGDVNSIIADLPRLFDEILTRFNSADTRDKIEHLKSLLVEYQYEHDPERKQQALENYPQYDLTAKKLAEIEPLLIELEKKMPYYCRRLRGSNSCQFNQLVEILIKVIEGRDIPTWIINIPKLNRKIKFPIDSHEFNIIIGLIGEEIEDFTNKPIHATRGVYRGSVSVPSRDSEPAFKIYSKIIDILSGKTYQNEISVPNYRIIFNEVPIFNELNPEIRNLSILTSNFIRDLNEILPDTNITGSGSNIILKYLLFLSLLLDKIIKNKSINGNYNQGADYRIFISQTGNKVLYPIPKTIQEVFDLLPELLKDIDNYHINNQFSDISAEFEFLKNSINELLVHREELIQQQLKQHREKLNIQKEGLRQREISIRKIPLLNNGRRIR